MLQIFISYRRDDSGGWVGRLIDHLKHEREFQDGGIFFDMISIEAGVDFMQRIEAAIHVSDVLVAVIGKRWMDIVDKAGKRRIQKPDDPVRNEIALAIKFKVPLLPVVVGGAHMMNTDDLPDDIQPLTAPNAVSIDNPRFEDDFKGFMEAIRRLSAERRREGATEQVQIETEHFLVLGKHYLHIKDYPSARACLTAALARDPHLAAIYVGLAQCSQLEAFSQIVRRNFGIANDLLVQGEDMIRKASQYEDADPKTFVQMAYVRKDIAQAYTNAQFGWEEGAAEARRKARTYFQMALGVDERNVSALNGMASIAILEKKWDEALEWLSKVFEIEPDLAAARHDLVQAHYGRFLAAENREARKKVAKDVMAALTDVRELQEKPGTEKLPEEAMTSLARIAARVTSQLSEFKSTSK